MITLSKKIFKSISFLIEYSLAGEKRHWEECGKPKDHIYTEIRRIRRWLNTKQK